MQRPIRPDWLLRQAEELAVGTGGRGQPRNADLRRAVSSAYYAVFHFTTTLAAAHLLPDATEIERQHLTRNFEHKAVKQVCDGIVSTQPPGNKSPTGKAITALMGALRTNQRMWDYAFAFQQLYEARHEADYDHTANFSRPAALAYVVQAEDAVRDLASQATTADFERFVVLLSLKLKS